MKKVTYFQPNAKDPVLEEKIILEIVKKYDPTVDTVDFIDETGGEARAYSVNNKIILKVQRPHRLRDKTSLEREVVFLNHLKKYPEITVPLIYGYGKVGEIEYTCMSKIPGKAIKYLEIPDKAREKILEELGKTLFLIHNVDNEPLKKSGLFPIDTLSEMKERLAYEFDWKLERVEGRTKEEITEAKKLATSLLSKITNDNEFVVLHSNPATTHTFVTEDFAFSGLIDFGDAYISHPVLDLKRWALEDRQHVIKGYFKISEGSQDFQQVLKVCNSLDKIIEILKGQKVISNLQELL